MTLKQERVFTGVFLFFVCLQLAHAVHSAWFAYAVGQGNPENVTVLFSTSKAAPQGYRLALPAMIRFVANILHLEDQGYVAAVFDLIAGFLALYLFYWLGVSVLPEGTKTSKARMLFILSFLAIIQFPLAWVVPRLRPETLPSALFLALALFSIAKMTGNKRWSVALLLATFCQCFVRADVPFAFGIALVLVGLWNRTQGALEASRSRILTGALLVLLSGAIQTYLQFIRLPHLRYPADARVIQVIPNLALHSLAVFTIAFLPYLCFFVVWALKRPVLNDVEVVVLASSVLYLLLWFSVGAISEVRIYVPFLLALSMVVARVSSSMLSGGSDSAN